MNLKRHTHSHNIFMPHLIVEYTENLPLDATGMLSKINASLAASGHFQEVDIKSRALMLDSFMVGTNPSGRGFAHARLLIMPGRSMDTKRDLSERVLTAMQDCVAYLSGLDLQLSVEVLELERETYAKVHLKT